MSRLVQIKITPKSSTPDVITTQEAKEYCRVDFDDDDGLFDQLIASSRQRLEQYSGRVFLDSDCVAIYEQQGCGDRILLSFSDNMVLPVDSAYKDLLTGESYIDTEDKKVELTYTAGYTASQMPQWVKVAVSMDVAYRYENRGDIAASVGINGELRAFMAPFVKMSFI